MVIINKSMVTIQTVVRAMSVRDTMAELNKKMKNQWFFVTEDRSYWPEYEGPKVEMSRTVKLNREHIVEIYSEG